MGKTVGVLPTLGKKGKMNQYTCYIITTFKGVSSLHWNNRLLACSFSKQGGNVQHLLDLLINGIPQKFEVEIIP